MTVPDVWMLTANDHFMAAPGGPLAERLLDMGTTADWWCWGNPYGGSPYHLSNHTCVEPAIRAGVASMLGPLADEKDVATIARDVADHFCCTGSRGARFQTSAGHTEHLLARKICGREGKHACGDHTKGWVNLRQTRLVQTVVRSTAGADCGRLANYQGAGAGWPLRGEDAAAPW